MIRKYNIIIVSHLSSLYISSPIRMKKHIMFISLKIACKIFFVNNRFVNCFKISYLFILIISRVVQISNQTIVIYLYKNICVCEERKCNEVNIHKDHICRH